MTDDDQVVAVPTTEEFGSDAALFAATMAWAEDATLADLYRNRVLVMQMMEWGLASGHEILERGGGDAPRLAHERWREVIELGRLAEPAVSAGGRHGAWERILVCVEDAARADIALTTALVPSDPSGAESGETPADESDDDLEVVAWASEPLAWALHQRGTRALLRDELKPARELLNESLVHRRDEEGRKVTKGNLVLLPLAVLPFALLLFIPLFIGGVAVTQITPFDESAGTADITPDSFVFRVAGDTRGFMVRNVGDTAVWVRSIAIEEDTDDVFEIVTRDDGQVACEVDGTIAAGRSCRIVVSADGPAATALLTVSVQSRSGKSKGDQSTVLINDPGGG